MKFALLNAIIDSIRNKDFGQQANVGAHFANRRTHTNNTCAKTDSENLRKAKK